MYKTTETEIPTDGELCEAEAGATIIVPNRVPLDAPAMGVFRYQNQEGEFVRAEYKTRRVFELKEPIDEPIEAGTKFYIPFIDPDFEGDGRFEECAVCGEKYWDPMIRKYMYERELDGEWVCYHH